MRNKTILQIIFCIYNIFFGVLSVWILLYVGTYLNGMVIPDSLRWENGVIIKSPNWNDAILILMLMIEAIVLMYVLFLINNKFLKRILITPNYKLVSKRTTLIISIIPFLFILACLYFLKVEIDSPF